MAGKSKSFHKVPRVQWPEQSVLCRFEPHPKVKPNMFNILFISE
jgi:hypothetical protein